MKKCKKIICTTFILILLLQTFIIPVHANSDYIIYGQNNKLEATLVNGWKNIRRTINVEKLNISGDYLSKVYHLILLNNPEYFYIKTNFKYTHRNNKVLSITPEYITTNGKKINSMKKQINKQADMILSGIAKNMTKYQKCLYIHDMLAQHTSYKSVNVYSYNMYGPLVDRVGVCQGYVCAYNYLLKKIGIASCVVASETMKHTWNKVRLNYKWYHIDVTHDDKITCESLNAEEISHDNFLLSDYELKNNGYNNWSCYGSNSCNNTYIQNSIHKKALNGIFQVKKDFYYIDKNYNLIKNGKNNKNLFKIGANKLVKGYNTTFYVTNLPCLMYYKNNLYFNDCEKIYKYNLKKNKITTIKCISKKDINDNNFIVNLVIRKNNKVYYIMRNYKTNNYTQKRLKI